MQSASNRGGVGRHAQTSGNGFLRALDILQPAAGRDEGDTIFFADQP
jgi:hypothetical protein